MTPARWLTIAQVADLAPGAMRRVKVASVGVLLLSNVDGEVFCTQDQCTHAKASLSMGWLDGCVVSCPVHGGEFDVRTGAALSFPAEVPLRTYLVRIADGEIQVELQEALDASEG